MAQNTGSAPAGVYNPLTFKVEPLPEQNIRNILLSNQHTLISHDANAFVDESDYMAQYGAADIRSPTGHFRYVPHVLGSSSLFPYLHVFVHFAMCNSRREST